VSFDYPVFLDLTGVDVLVVGGGPVGIRKADGLVAAGARVTLVAPDVQPGVAPQVTVIRREYRSDDLEGRQLVVAATSEPQVNARVASDARHRRIFVNSADDPENCSFILPAITRRGRMSVAVSSGGASPALAQHVRARIAEEVLTPDIVAAADTLAAERDVIHAQGRSTEGLDWAGRLAQLLTGRKGDVVGDATDTEVVRGR
jgi:siroheme synthase-like protein